ncbi:MAG: hypothetical protein A2W94_02380 [Bacteroidetes bacterium GWE2_42_42]|nr:MAG: hypothetical protein A2W94_02380 [Bacteroidetes bacterium GWE2_42_42]
MVDLILGHWEMRKLAEAKYFFQKNLKSNIYYRISKINKRPFSDRLMILGVLDLSWMLQCSVARICIKKFAPKTKKYLSK